MPIDAIVISRLYYIEFVVWKKRINCRARKHVTLNRIRSLPRETRIGRHAKFGRRVLRTQVYHAALATARYGTAPSLMPKSVTEVQKDDAYMTSFAFQVGSGLFNGQWAPRGRSLRCFRIIRVNSPA